MNRITPCIVHHKLTYVTIELEGKTDRPGTLIEEKLRRRFDREKAMGSLDYGENYHQDHLMALLTFLLRQKLVMD